MGWNPRSVIAWTDPFGDQWQLPAGPFPAKHVIRAVQDSAEKIFGEELPVIMLENVWRMVCIITPPLDSTTVLNPKVIIVVVPCTKLFWRRAVGALSDF